MLREIMKYGLPTGVQNSVIGLANVILQSNVNSFGEDAMAGYGSYVKIEGFAFLPITCFSMAMTTFISIITIGTIAFPAPRHTPAMIWENASRK